MPSRYNPDKHHRRSIRLKGYDYSTLGAYFITALVKNRECILSEIRAGEIKLSALGEIVNQCWNEIPKRFPSVQLDAFVIMPNHIHGIIVLTGEAQDDLVRAGLAPAPDARVRATARVAPTKVGDIVGAFKSLCFTTWYDYIKQNNLDLIAKFWHRNYGACPERSEGSTLSATNANAIASAITSPQIHRVGCTTAKMQTLKISTTLGARTKKSGSLNAT